jgi:hypothetical protein
MREHPHQWAWRNLATDGQSYRSFLLGQVELCIEIVEEAAKSGVRDTQGRPLIFVRQDRSSNLNGQTLLWIGYKALQSKQQHGLNYVVSVICGLEFVPNLNRLLLPADSSAAIEEIVSDLSKTVAIWGRAKQPFSVYRLNDI